MKKRVVAAMSGGVDSSVAAALLVEQGYDVIGVTMQLWPEEDALEEARRGGCCSLAAVEDARRVAGLLGIPYYILNLREAFAERVIDYFVDEYARGRTPNPCIACNRWVKFDLLLRRARELDADYLATGHYARAWYDPERGRYVLARPADRRKDQTYVLYGLTQEQLARVLFPLGDLTKEEVRRLAARLGLPVATKPESQDICFLPEGEHGPFVAARAGERVRPGPILDRRGRVLGTHRGLPFYTVGQRRGLGLGGGRPLYVLALDPERNAVIVGEWEEGLASGVEVSDLNLILLDWDELAALPGGLAAQVQIRYRAQPRPAVVQAVPGAPGRVRVEFSQPVHAATPGQAAVFYDGDLVVGGGTIDRVLTPALAAAAADGDGRER